MVDNDTETTGNGFIDTQLITLSGIGPYISAQIPSPIELDHENFDYKIGLKKIQTYYAFPNITENVNNQLKIRPGKSAKFIPISLHTGAYELSHINDAILTQLKEKTAIKNPEIFFTLSANISTFKSVITLSGDGWAVDFNVIHSLASVLGFEKKLIEGKGIHSSKHTVQIQVFNSLLFLTDITYPSILNDKYIPYIYHHSKHTAPGFNIVVEPANISYKSLTTNVLSHINLWVQDEKGHAVNFNNENLTVELKLIRKSRKKHKLKLNNNTSHFG